MGTEEIFDAEIEIEDDEYVSEDEDDYEGYLMPRELAELAGFKSDGMMRYYSDEFTEFVTIIRSSRGHRRYLSKDVPVWTRIRELCQDQKVTISDAKEIMKSEGFEPVKRVKRKPSGVAAPMDNSAALLMKQMDFFRNEVSRVTEESEKRIKACVRETKKETSGKLASMTELIEKQNEMISSQSETIERQSELIAKLYEEMEQVKEQTKKKKHFWQR